MLGIDGSAGHSTAVGLAYFPAYDYVRASRAHLPESFDRELCGNCPRFVIRSGLMEDCPDRWAVKSRPDELRSDVPVLIRE